ncbi:hypothetical protein P4O66_001853 [Electrophorus voltai]|uniref:Reverse transcriptase domain-containing protein n=1 Tax=Electrophorus voltai TaxID=2609070 RepID=A0AAD9DR52_9TELE|nr:hypothetical protein P4O66_001853 [Electrophorus voltai]
MEETSLSLLNPPAPSSPLTNLLAAFDTVNHNILLSVLSRLGVTGSAWRWFQSYLEERSYKVSKRILACLTDIVSWITAHYLKLNPSKTKLLFIPGTPNPYHDLTVSFKNSQMRRDENRIRKHHGTVPTATTPRHHSHGDHLCIFNNSYPELLPREQRRLGYESMARSAFAETLPAVSLRGFWSQYVLREQAVCVAGRGRPVSSEGSDALRKATREGNPSGPLLEPCGSANTNLPGAGAPVVGTERLLLQLTSIPWPQENRDVCVDTSPIRDNSLAVMTDLAQRWDCQGPEQVSSPCHSKVALPEERPAVSGRRKEGNWIGQCEGTLQVMNREKDMVFNSTTSGLKAIGSEAGV